MQCTKSGCCIGRVGEKNGEETDWDEQFNWSELQKDYTKFNAPLTDNVLQRLQDNISSDQFQERGIPEINIADVNEGKTQFDNILTEIL